MTTRIRNHDEARLDGLRRDDEGRVQHGDCSVVEASLMLPAGTTKEQLRELMDRLYEREPTVLHWATNWLEAASEGTKHER